MSDTNAEITPRHQWTNGGSCVRLLRCENENGKAYGGFLWPDKGLVESPEMWDDAWGDEPDDFRAGWILDNKCGGGLHGWPWGLDIGAGKDPNYSGIWRVFEANPGDIVLVENDGKCKVKKANVIFTGSFIGAQLLLIDGRVKWTEHSARGSASATGERGSASATGERGSASATGESGSASATGWSGIAALTESDGLIETSGKNSLAATTSNRFRWKVRDGAVLVQRTDKGIWLLKAEDMSVEDGTIVTIEHGKRIDA